MFFFSAIAVAAVIIRPESAVAQPPAGFTLTGHITGLPEKSMVYITDANKPGDTLARSAVKGGKFVLKGTLTEPNLFELNLAGIKKKAPLFIGNDVAGIEGSSNALNLLKITGSPSHADFVAFQEVFNPGFQQLNAISQMANSSEGAAKRDSLATAYQQTTGIIETKVDSFLQAKNRSYVSAFLLMVVNQLSDDPFQLERRYNQLASNVQQGMFGKYLREQIETGKIGAVGSSAMDFTQNDTAGHPVSLSSYKGKYVLVDFWASWCRPCRMENPHVVSAYGRFKDKNFTVLGISLDRDRSAWIKAIQDDNLGWAQVSDLKFWNNEVAQKYKVQQIPQNFLIDPQGKIVGKNLRGDELDARLCALLGCN